jgi:glutamate dehydrogenase
MGTIFVPQLEASTGARTTELVLAYRVARQLLDAERSWDLLERAGEIHDPARILELEETIDRLVARITATLAVDPLLRDPGALLERDRAVAEALLEQMLTLGSPDQRRARLAYARWLVDDLIDPDLARFLACAGDLAMIPDVAVVMTQVEGDRGRRRGGGRVPPAGRDARGRSARGGPGACRRGRPLARRQRGGLANDLRRLRRDAALAALQRFPDDDEPTAVRRFLDERPAALERVELVAQEVVSVEDAGLEAVAVAARTVRDAIDRGA